MKTLVATAGVLGILLVLAGQTATRPAGHEAAQGPTWSAWAPPVATSAASASETSNEALTAVVQRYCQVCHNDAMLTGNLSLQGFDVAAAPQKAEIAERMIRKLRAGMMPPPGMPRPGADTLQVLVETLETLIDEAAAADPNPGSRTFQRLNRAEYEAAIRDLLGLEVNAGAWLPLDTKSANFDNIADVQLLSPTLLDAYLSAAAEISRLAIGNPNATPSEATYSLPRSASQTDHVPGTPYGTRGGISVVHNFPADGNYIFRISFYHETTGGFVGGLSRGEQLEIAIDGERAALLAIDRFMNSSDPNQVTMFTDPVPIGAGPHQVAAAFIPPQFQGVVQDLISPLGWSLASTAIDNTYGFSLLPHLRDVVIVGPYDATGVSETPVRRNIFTCRPTAPKEERTCAEAIVTRLGTRAFRRPLTAKDVGDLMSFYDAGAAKAGFESGVRTALEAMLASPDFLFRFEETPADARPGRSYRLSDTDLASRLSFFLWGTPPDDQLLEVAREGKLSDTRVLERQTRRLLADRRSEALATRFAAQWLRLSDLAKVFPDVRQYTDFDEQLRASMQRETELFFDHLVREDRSVLDLYTADYTFVDERLARHYGIPNVAGDHFRRMTYPDDSRKGLFGHASILVLTSHAVRTSPVLRGKWVMEVILGAPPPPPPPGVPALDATAGVKDGRFLTTRERMEMHRSNPICAGCHQFMDPIGLSLDNFDVTGKWRIKENGMPLDTRGRLYDGTPVASPADLQRALLQRPIPLIRTFTQNLMAYALGRRVEYYDMPTVRAIAKQAAASDYRMSSFILGVVNSPAFRMQRVEAVAAEAQSSR